MARCRQEFRFRDIGGIGFAFRALECGVESSQLLGAFVHAPLQRFVGALQRLRSFDARRNVRVGRDDAAVWHAVGANLDHQALREALQEGLIAGDVALDLHANEFLNVRRSNVAARAVETQNVGEPNTHANQAWRQIEDFAELPVPADQLQFLVKYGDALAHVIKRRLQNLAVVLNCRIGVVQELQRRFGRNSTFAQKQRQNQPRRCAADCRGENMLRIPDQSEVRVVLWLKTDALRAGKAFKSRLRSLFAEIARNSGGELILRYRRPPQPEAGSNRCEVRGDESVGLQSLDR